MEQQQNNITEINFKQIGVSVSDSHIFLSFPTAGIFGFTPESAAKFLELLEIATLHVLEAQKKRSTIN